MREGTYKNYVLTLLTVVLSFNYVDRLAFSLLLQDIKTDLALTDTQLGFMSGIAFAVFYSVLGIPIARWADYGNRVTIITATTAVWSFMVAVCGFAGSFVQLLLCRIGVAVGEAGCMPPANSLIADYFTRSERPRAMARFLFGIPLSAILGYFVAGWLNQFFGWRTTFIVLGAPGPVLALITWLTLRETRAGMVAPWSANKRSTAVNIANSHPENERPRVIDVAKRLWSIRTFRQLLFGFSVIYFFGYGISKWQPAFFVRSHGVQTGELGTWFALIYGLVALVGVYLGGEWASRFAKNDESLQLRMIAFAFICFGVMSACAYLAPNRYLAFGLFSIGVLAFNMTNGPMFAVIQSVVPERMRAMSVGILYLFANLIGMGLGPLAAGVLSDAFRAWAGQDSLRFALLALCPGYLWASWHFFRSSHTVSGDLINMDNTIRT